MPRRKDPLQPSGHIVPGSGITMSDVRSIIRCIRRYPNTSSLPRIERHRLMRMIFHAVSHARIGLSHWLSGKEVRPTAWMLDVFTHDLMGAWQTVGLRPTVRADATGTSEFLSFAHDLAKCTALHANRDTLFPNAVRARDIEAL
jgi:hypothetical protein